MPAVFNGCIVDHDLYRERLAEAQDADEDRYCVNNDDCDDSDPSHDPGAVELCDTRDNDCNGTVDDSSAIDSSAWYQTRPVW